MSKQVKQEANIDTIKMHLSRLKNALRKKRSEKWCLQLWSRFIKERDGHRCVNCESKMGIQAHHILRKVVCPLGMFELGNGITLCNTCHKKVHEAFNKRPEQEERLNERGGDDPDYIAYLYGLLADDAKERELPENEFYYLSDIVLDFFNWYQGYYEITDRLGQLQSSRIRIAHEIWRVAPIEWYTALGNWSLKVLMTGYDGPFDPQEFAPPHLLG
ncbi:hypothetical protein [Tumebacillus avium]|uniref:hypothetical protein n=1 Tax=Tumebacillus avium TaxID=1903704 RepID=UPI000B3B1C98|nr:hypothetical protein [Tumebacillus avium]